MPVPRHERVSCKHFATALPAAPCRQDLSVATSQIGDLFARVRDIQAKAADSEVLVQEICRDIRKVRGYTALRSAGSRALKARAVLRLVANSCMHCC
jgi:hypothetical protein